MQPASAPRVPVPNLLSDPVWSLSVWPVIITAAGVDYEIPALPARDWLAVLMVADLDPEAVFPGLAGADDEIDDAIMAGTVDPDEVDQVALDVITAVSGRPWWVALRLIAVARQSWQILGAKMITKVDAGRVSLSAWLDALLLEIMEQIEDKDAQMFVLRLESPPPHLADEAPEPEMSASAFLALAGDG